MLKKELVNDLKKLGISTKDNRISKSDALAALKKVDKAIKKKEIEADLKKLGIVVRNGHIRKVDAMAMLKKISKKRKSQK